MVELLVVIAIIGILIALLLPAVQAAREAARKVHCRNNLKQMGLAFLVHEEAHKHFPVGGWGNRWAGDADRGSGLRQPGPWGYNILPQLEQLALHQLGAAQNDEGKAVAMVKRVETVVPVFSCPSRGARLVLSDEIGIIINNVPSALFKKYYRQVVFPCDYAINAGETTSWTKTRSPGSYQEGDDPNFTWDMLADFTGIGGARHCSVRVADVDDGLSNTYLVGEQFKFLECYSNVKDCLAAGGGYEGSPFGPAYDPLHRAFGFSRGLGRDWTSL